MLEINRAIIALSNRCNLNCDYCFVKRNDLSRLNEQQIKTFIKWFINQPGNSDYKKISFLGGEPFLEFDLLKSAILFFKKHNTNKKCIIDNIYTNGTVMTQEILDFIKKEKLRVSFSLDGDRISNFARKFKNGKNCYDTVWNNMRKFREFIAPPYITMVVLPSNVKNLYSNIKFLIENGFYKISFQPCFIKVRWSYESSNLFLNKFKKIVYLYLCFLLLKKPIYIWPITEVWGKNIEELKDEDFHCGFGDQPFLSFDGNIYNCELSFSDQPCFKNKFIIGRVTNKKVVINIIKMQEYGKYNIFEQYNLRNKNHSAAHLFRKMICYAYDSKGRILPKDYIENAMNIYLKMIELPLRFSNSFRKLA